MPGMAFNRNPATFGNTVPCNSTPRVRNPQGNPARGFRGVVSPPPQRGQGGAPAAIAYSDLGPEILSLRLLFCITSYSPYLMLSCERIPALESKY